MVTAWRAGPRLNSPVMERQECYLPRCSHSRGTAPRLSKNYSRLLNWQEVSKDIYIQIYIHIYLSAYIPTHMGFPSVSVVKNLPAVQEIQVPSLGWEDPLEREWQPTLVFLLENSMDRGAWRATVYGVTKSQTQLKPLRTHTLTHIHIHVCIASV